MWSVVFGIAATGTWLIGIAFQRSDAVAKGRSESLSETFGGIRTEIKELRDDHETLKDQVHEIDKTVARHDERLGRHVKD